MKLKPEIEVYSLLCSMFQSEDCDHCVFSTSIHTKCCFSQTPSLYVHEFNVHLGNSMCGTFSLFTHLHNDQHFGGKILTFDSEEFKT